MLPLFFVIYLFFSSVSFAAQELPYFTTESSPPTAQREPPYEGTRKHIEKKDYYVHIRFPYVSARESENDFGMKLSVGNEIQKPIGFLVDTWNIRCKDQEIRIHPYYFDPKNGEKREGMEALKIYRHILQPNLHGEVQAMIPRKELETETPCELELKVFIYLPEQTDVVEETFTIHRGYYEAI